MWIIYALLAAISDASRLAISKRLTGEFRPIQIVFLASIISFPVLLGAFYSYIDFSVMTPSLWALVIFETGFMYVGGSVLLNEALKKSDFSIVMPIMTLSPIFLLILEPIFLGERAGILGLIGVLLSLSGSYFLNFNKRSDGFLEPLKHLVYDKGAQLALLAGLTFSFGAVIDRYVMRTIPVEMYSILFMGFGALISFFILVFKKQVTTLNKSSSFKFLLLLLGIFMAGNVIFSLIPMKDHLGAYTLSIKRFSGLFGIIIAYLFFHEKESFKQRLLAAMIMIAGVFLIAMD